MPNRNLISIKRFGGFLYSKPSAEEIRKTCEVLLDPDQVLIINMAGVHDLSVGFADECFGKLYLSAQRRESKIKFDMVKAPIRVIIRKGIMNAIKATEL